MILKLIANIESFGDAGYIAWINNSSKLKGTVVQANSPENAVKELLISLRAKFAYDYGLEIEQVQGKEVDSFDDIEVVDIQKVDGNALKEIKFSFA